MTKCAARQSQIEAERSEGGVHSKNYGQRWRINMAMPQQAGCHLLTSRVNNTISDGVHNLNAQMNP